MRLGLFGLPGAGKGTQAQKIAQKWVIPHISTGDIFRELQKGNTTLAKEIRGILARGELVSDDMVTKIAFDRLANEDCKRGFVLDGFPRTLNQARALEASPFSLDVLLVIDVAKAEIVKRLSSRRVCGHCHSVYSGEDGQDLIGNLCPKDGHILIQRPDDMPEAVAIRLELFERNFSPIMDFYQSLGRLCRIDGQGPVDTVFERIRKVIGQLNERPKRDK